MTENEMPPISVLTLNPAVDISYEIEELHADQKNYARVTRNDPGGNGVNVARALERLGLSPRHFGFSAGKIGLLLKELLHEQLADGRWIEVEGETRLNATFIQASPPAQFEITGVGPYIPPDAAESLRSQFLDHCYGGYGILTGSMPPGIPYDFYSRMLDDLDKVGARSILDTNGSHLRLAIEHCPFFIKPNQHEIEQFCGRRLHGLEDIAIEAKKIHESGVAYVCVSMGRDGALLACSEGTFFGYAPRVECKSSVGAGDSMVGGMVTALIRGMGSKEMLALGVACGSGTSLRVGTELFIPSDIDHLIDMVRVESILV
ncbi:MULTISPECIES: 1-phosphofructokinase family hexose kinase [Acidithrix]|uniref:6-phosphofructokinase isozyme 2 n=1 Tax=Acidithrix ferrooxidans TaxID=1280514 RepID=A0A0D8HDR1_9ACTN|nr:MULTISPECIES: 1-phosphofructokinase family hexose kinase [Acidithrix]KJF16068.1 6-phosphofructokinase isozyme 2 [Acidithrix ferrooxidans]CAG4904611.1 unnamed protein product [Acidithrix sp. C25]